MYVSPPVLRFSQVELDQEKGLEMRKWVLSGILASEEAYLSQLEALLIVSQNSKHMLTELTEQSY